MGSDARFFKLILRIVQESPKDREHIQYLTRLKKYVFEDIEKLFSEDTPENVSEIFYNFDYELERFSEFASFPDFSEKNIVGIGGKFSSGKSTFLNRIIVGKNILPTSTTPTTSIPTLIGRGDKNISVLNIFNNLISIDEEELKMLRHHGDGDTQATFTHLLKHIFVQVPTIDYQNLVFLDTPGVASQEEEYSEQTDETRALAQLNNSSHVIWCIDCEAGTLTDSDIRFLKKINRKIPILMVLTKADKKTKTQDVERVVSHIKDVVSNSGLNVLDVLPHSSKRTDRFSFDNIDKYLKKWDKDRVEPLFAKNFKKFFVSISDFYLSEEDNLKRLLNRINKALSFGENEYVINEFTIIRDNTKRRLKRIQDKQKKLDELREKFFAEVKRIGDISGVSLPEPAEIELIDVEFNFSKLLGEYVKGENIRAQTDYGKLLSCFFDVKWSLFEGRDYNSIEFPEKTGFLSCVNYKEMLRKVKFSPDINLNPPENLQNLHIAFPEKSVFFRTNNI